MTIAGWPLISQRVAEAEAAGARVTLLLQYELAPGIGEIVVEWRDIDGLVWQMRGRSELVLPARIVERLRRWWRSRRLPRARARLVAPVANDGEPPP